MNVHSTLIRKMPRTKANNAGAKARHDPLATQLRKDEILVDDEEAAAMGGGKGEEKIRRKRRRKVRKNLAVQDDSVRPSSSSSSFPTHSTHSTHTPHPLHTLPNPSHPSHPSPTPPHTHTPPTRKIWMSHLPSKFPHPPTSSTPPLIIRTHNRQRRFWRQSWLGK